MSILAAALIDQAKLVSNNRRNLAISDPDWLVFVNWAVESWWKFRTSLDEGLYFASLDFTLAGGARGAYFDMAGTAFTVKWATTAALNVTSSGVGVGMVLTEVGSGAIAIDGGAPALGDLVLVKDQGSVGFPQSNGIFTVTQVGNGGSPYKLTRWTGFDELLSGEMALGARISVTAGATNINTAWYLSALSGSIDVAGMVQTYTLGPGLGIRAAHGIDVNPDTGSRYTLRGRNFKQRNQSVGWWIPTQWCPVRYYDVRAFQVTVTPYEAAAGTYRLYYRGAPYKFAGTTDTTPLDAVLEPESEAIVKLAAMSALNIEETSDDPYAKRVQAVKAEVQAVYQRDDGQAFQIADVEGCP